MKNLKRIIISGDIFRFKNLKNKFEPFNYIRIIRYYNLLQYQLEKASGLKVEILNSQPDHVCMDIYEILGVAVKDQFDWVKIYDVKDIPAKLIEWYGEKIRDSIVIYNEPSKTIKRIHNILGIPYIDIMPHPIRYLDDHLFAVSTNDKYIFEYFKTSEIKNYESFAISAQLIKTQLATPISGLVDNSLLLVGQTELDKSLIVDGKLKSINSFYDKIVDLLNDYNHIYFTPHPYVSDYKIYSCLSNIDKCSIVKNNTYNLLSQPQITGIAGISSSAIYEGRFFGKKTHFFYKNYECMKENPEFSEDYFFTLSKEQILQPSFWSIIFGKKANYININYSPNQIRAALNDYWSYTEYDPVLRTVKRSAYGDNLSKLIKLNINSELSKIKEKYNKSFTSITEQHNSDCIKNTKTKSLTKNNSLFVIKLFDGIGLGALSELVMFKGLSDKLKRYVPLARKEKVIHCITYRPKAPNGGRGGAGAVQSAMEILLGKSFGDYLVKYTYSERDGVWHSDKNKFFTRKRFPKIFRSNTSLMQLWANMVFIFDKTKDEGGVFITHEIFSAFSLALLKKKYVLVLHSQGSKIHEMTALGEYTNTITRYIINKCEDIALSSAYKIYFPSIGARKAFLKDKKYLGSNISELPLYNTIYAHPDLAPYGNCFKTPEVITFISIGTLTKSKGQDLTLSYIENISVNNPDKKIRWICIGRGPLKDDLVKESNKFLSTNKNCEILFYEKVPYSSVRYLLSISDIYIMLHRVSIFDLATLEAMENGLMIVLSRVGGNKEFDVCKNIIYSDINYPLENNYIEKYKELSKQAFRYFNNSAFCLEYKKVFEDLIQ